MKTGVVVFLFVVALLPLVSASVLQDEMVAGVNSCNAGDYSEALSNFDHVIEIDSSYPNGWLWRGTVLEKLGRYDEAAKAFEKGRCLLSGSCNPKNKQEITMFTWDGYSYEEDGRAVLNSEYVKTLVDPVTGQNVQDLLNKKAHSEALLAVERLKKNSDDPRLDELSDSIEKVLSGDEAEDFETESQNMGSEPKQLPQTDNSNSQNMDSDKSQLPQTGISNSPVAQDLATGIGDTQENSLSPEQAVSQLDSAENLYLNNDLITALNILNQIDISLLPDFDLTRYYELKDQINQHKPNDFALPDIKYEWIFLPIGLILVYLLRGHLFK